MWTASKLRTLALATILCYWRAAYAQDVPPINCPQYFEYARDGYDHVGRILLTDVPIGTANIKASFSQRGLPRTSYYGSIVPYPNEAAVVRDVLSGRPVEFRVNFALPNEPPKLTHLALNGQELCTGTAYSPPHSWYDLTYTLHTVNTRHGDHRFNFDASWQYNRERDPYPVQTVPVQPFAPITLGPTIPPRSITTTTTTTTTTTPAYHEIRTEERNRPGAQVDLNGVCGVEGTVVRAFVYGGTDVARGQFPWLTAVYQKDADALTFMCGGTLLSKRTVLSAAHCFKGLRADQTALFFGRHDLQSYSENNEIVSRDVLQVVTHPDYKTNTPDADLAVLHMEPIDSFNQYIKPICLWVDSTESRQSAVDKTATVVGWGFEEKDSVDVASLPKMVEVKIVSNDECLRSSAAYEGIITERTVCAGNRDGRGPCIGDSGGGLMVIRRGRWVLRGVVSVGQSSRKQCNLHEYVVYCDLAQHMPWVRENMLE